MFPRRILVYGYYFHSLKETSNSLKLSEKLCIRYLHQILLQWGDKTISSPFYRQEDWGLEDVICSVSHKEWVLELRQKPRPPNKGPPEINVHRCWQHQDCGTEDEVCIIDTTRHGTQINPKWDFVSIYLEYSAQACGSRERFWLLFLTSELLSTHWYQWSQ